MSPATVDTVAITAVVLGRGAPRASVLEASRSAMISLPDPGLSSLIPRVICARQGLAA